MLIMKRRAWSRLYAPPSYSFANVLHSAVVDWARSVHIVGVDVNIIAVQHPDYAAYLLAQEGKKETALL
jgi:hypothetical protein